MPHNRGKQFGPSSKIQTGHHKAQSPTPSSNILDHSYSPETVQLTITFHGGRRYLYKGVPQEIADGLDAADSKGRFIAGHIIDKFDHEKLPLDG